MARPHVQPRRTFITLDSFLITIFLSSLFRNFGAYGNMITCYKNNPSLNPIQSSYQTNLQNLLANMATNASSSSFQSSTVGESPDEAYGLYYCRGDTTTELCHSCVVDLTKWVANGTDFCGEGFGYLDNCMLRYANYSFFGRADNELLGSIESADNVTNVVEFNRTVRGVIEGLVKDTASGSVSLFATREEAVVGGGEGKVYGLAQCSPDIGRVHCNVCLKKAASYVQKCCEPKKKVWAMFSSCQLRYDNSSFYRKSGANGRAVSGSLLIAGWTVLLLFHWLV